MVWQPGPYPTPLPSYRQQVPVPGVDPDTGPCVCVQFNPAWQPYIMGALEQLTNPQTWDTTDPGTLSLTLAQVDRLREMFGSTDGCATAPPAPPVSDTDDIDCKIASYLVRTVVKEVIQSAIFIVFPPDEELSLLERMLDLIPGVGDFLGTLGLTSKNIATFISGTVGLEWVETAAEDAVWDAIGCAVYDGVIGVHEITQDVLDVIQPAIEALDIAFPEFLEAVANAFGDIGADVLNELANLATTTDFNCAGCGGETPTITGTDPQTYLPRPLELVAGATDITQVRRVTFSNATATLDADTTDEVTVTAPAGISVEHNGTGAAQFIALNLEDSDGASWVLGSGGTGTLDLALDVSAGANLELSDGTTTLEGVSKLTFETGTLGGTADAATYTPPTSLMGTCLQATLTETIPLTEGGVTVLLAMALDPGTYLLSANVTLDNTAATSAVQEVDLYDGTAALASADEIFPATGPMALAITPFRVTFAAPTTLYLRAYTDDSGIQANAEGTEDSAPATWMAAQVPGGGATGAPGPNLPLASYGISLSEGYYFGAANSVENVLSVTVPAGKWLVITSFSTYDNTSEVQGCRLWLTDGTTIYGGWSANNVSNGQTYTGTLCAVMEEAEGATISLAGFVTSTNVAIQSNSSGLPAAAVQTALTVVQIG